MIIQSTERLNSHSLLYSMHAGLCLQGARCVNYPKCDMYSDRWASFIFAWHDNIQLMPLTQLLLADKWLQLCSQWFQIVNCNLAHGAITKASVHPPSVGYKFRSTVGAMLWWLLHVCEHELYRPGCLCRTTNATVMQYQMFTPSVRQAMLCNIARDAM